MAETLDRDRAELLRLRRNEELLRIEKAHAEALARVTSRLNARLDVEAVLGAVCEEAARAMGTGVSAAYLLDDARDVMVFAASFGLPADYGRRARPVPRAIHDEYNRRCGPVVVIPDLQAVAGMPNPELYAELGIRTAVVAEMAREGQVVGGLSVYTLVEPRRFTEDELTLLKALADAAAQAVANARLYDDARRRLQQVQALRTIDVAISSSLDLRVTLDVFLEQATARLGVDAAAVLLLDDHTRTLRCGAARGLRGEAVRRTILRLGEGNAGRVALDRRVMAVGDVGRPPGDFDPGRLPAGEGFRAYFASPLVTKGHVRGVLEIFHRAPLDPDAEWLDFLEALSAQAAIAADTSLLFDGLHRANIELTLAYDTTIEGWSRALDLRDRETEGHSMRVAGMTERLGRAIGVGGNDLVQIHRGALLHDIGKMGIPDGILLKPGPLTPEEWAIMRKHPEYAHDLLSPIEYLRPALDIPYCHHEKWDGTGYPRGLRDERIPLSARIFAVVDVWDALRSDRPYRVAWPIDKALAHVRSLSGSHFEPKVLEAFLRSEAWKLEEQAG